MHLLRARLSLHTARWYALFLTAVNIWLFTGVFGISNLFTNNVANVFLRRESVLMKKAIASGFDEVGAPLIVS